MCVTWIVRKSGPPQTGNSVVYVKYKKSLLRAELLKASLSLIIMARYRERELQHSRHNVLTVEELQAPASSIPQHPR